MKKILFLFFTITALITFQNQAYSQVLAEAGSETGYGGGGSGGGGCLICELEKYFAKYMGWGSSSAKGSWTKEKDSRTVYSGGGWYTRAIDAKGNQVAFGRDTHGRPTVSKAYLDNLKDTNRSEYYRIKDGIKKEEQKCNCILILY